MSNETSSNDGDIGNPVAAPTPNAWIDLFNKARKEWYPFLKRWGKFAFSRYFVEESLIKAFLEKTELNNIGSTNFINYDNWHHYYANEARKISCVRGQSEVDIVLPYQEVVDFVTNPSTLISIQPDIGSYESSDELRQLTQEAFKKYIEEKPKTTDGPIVRLSRLNNSEGDFYATLERSSYFEQVRTNLSLDYIMRGGSTLRAKDFGNSNQLPEFDKSLMVNSIGVSGVVYFSRGTRKYFLMKLRKGTEGVFELMFGTTSGVLELSVSQPNNLVELASKEMLREFCEETGVSKEDAMSVVSVTPLAFTRELMRGGKPQFFFLLEIPEDLEKKFKESFRSSQDGLNEFHDSVLNKASSYHHALSPEFAANLYYAYRYFNLQNKLPIEPVMI